MQNKRLSINKPGFALLLVLALLAGLLAGCGETPASSAGEESASESVAVVEAEERERAAEEC